MIKPKHTIKVGTTTMLNIYTTSHAADRLIGSIAPFFGSYFAPGNTADHHVLFVSPCWDADEVKEFFEENLVFVEFG